MKQIYSRSLLALMAMAMFTLSVSAQETKVTIKVEKDGEIIKDTSYTYDDSQDAEHAMEMIELLSDDNGHTVTIHKEMKEHLEGEEMKVMKYHVEVGDESDGEHVIVMKSGEGDDSWEIITSEGDEEEVEVIVVKKKVKSQKDGELHEEHELHEQEIEVEVEVEKETKKKKKSKKQ
jgi:hypothetical protein